MKLPSHFDFHGRERNHFEPALTIAAIPARIASGSSGHASITADNVVVG
jgi:hypothetical protein